MVEHDGSRYDKFRDSGVPILERVEDLLGKLTLGEKVGMLHQHCPPIPRLGLEYFHTGQEILHGAACGTATVFPQAVGLAAMWNVDLLERIGSAVAAEISEFQERDRSVSRNVWGPVVNLLRDPRWGRNEEGYSEDPLLTALTATAYCRGLCDEDFSDGTRRVVTAPTLKHFLAHNHETDKSTVSISLRPRVLREYDLPPFTIPVRSGSAFAVMAAYGIANGRPNHLSEYFAEMRKENPELAVVSDAFAPSGLVTDNMYYADREHAFAAALRCGLDSFTDQWTDPELTLAAIHGAFSLGILSEDDVDTAVRRLLSIRTSLGEFDLKVPARSRDVIDSPAHRSLAREAAQQAMVLLQNDGLLPLSSSGTGRIAVIGPLADRMCTDWYSPTFPYGVTALAGISERIGSERTSFTDGLDRIRLRAMAGGTYLTATDPSDSCGLKALAPQGGTNQEFDIFDWGEGSLAFRSASTGLFLSAPDGVSVTCDQEAPNGWVVRETFQLVQDGHGWVLRNIGNERYIVVDAPDVSATVEDVSAATRFDLEFVSRGEEDAARVAREADAVILVLGTHTQINGHEGRDRRELTLPERQEQVLRAAFEANPRTVAVLVSGHPIAATWAADNIPSVLWSSHGGQEFGNALAGALFGDYSPSGRLQQTWYRTTDDLGGIFDYDIIKSKLTYLYSERDPLYPFGHGLSYATFTYSSLSVSSDVIGDSDEISVDLRVSNDSEIDSDEVVQLYVRSLDSPVPRPLRELKGFRRIHLSGGEETAVSFSLAAADLAFWDVARGHFSVAPGRYEIMVGRSSSAIEQSLQIVIEGPPIPPRDLSSRLARAVDFDDWEKVKIADETRVRGEAIAAETAGGWLLFRDADLAGGLDSFTATVGSLGYPNASIELRLDDPHEGRILGRVAVPASTDVQYGWTTVTADLVDTFPDRGDIYLVFTDPARLSRFSLTSRHKSPRDLSNTTVKAADFDNWKGARITSRSLFHGIAVLIKEAGGWLLFRDVDLTGGLHGFTATAGSRGYPNACIEVRLDNPHDGPILGRIAVPETRNIKFGWETTTGDLRTTDRARGDVYLVFPEPARIFDFSFLRAKTS